MLRWNETRFSRVFGDESILSRLEQLGKNARNFENLVGVGFPEHQLDEAREWYADAARTPVEKYAAGKMAGGFFEDESLLSIYCRYFECTDWKLESSPWFYSKPDYRRVFKVLIDPVDYHVTQLEQGAGEERWGVSFLKLPFDLGMDEARRSIWQEIIQRDYFWKPQANYAHHRADQMFQYLKRSLDMEKFSPNHYNYGWEQNFRALFHESLRRFEIVLERRVREWQERRKAKTSHKFHYGSFKRAEIEAGSGLQQALAYFNLEQATVTLGGLRKSFRLLSKSKHPDHGGDPEEFRRLSACKDIVESWLRRRPRN